MFGFTYVITQHEPHRRCCKQNAQMRFVDSQLSSVENAVVVSGG